ncbi:MAG: hemolysin family protein [Ilumatobacteraceae bacterium]
MLAATLAIARLSGVIAQADPSADGGEPVSFTNLHLLMVVVILLLLVALIFLSVAEMGLSRMTRPRANSLAEKGVRGGKALKRLVDEPERWVNPVLLTVNLFQILQATLTGYVANDLFGPFGLVIGVVLNVVVFFVLAEAVPKTYAVLYPQKAALIAAGPVSALVAFPLLRWISQWLISLTNVIVRGKGLEQGPFVNEQELLGIVEVAAEDMVIEEQERELIESIIEFGDTVAREIMVPRPDMVTVPHDATVSAALDIAFENGFSRLPVLENAAESDGDVLGLAYAKDLMRAERSAEGSRPVRDYLRQVIIVPENKPVSRLMREMQAQKFHLALVADEYGAIAGLVTLEDCLEELVGEIVDEHDDDEAEVEHLADGDYLVDGSMSIGDINDLLGTEIPDDDWDTVGGFLFGTLEHVPEEGESVVRDGWRFSAAEMEGRRVRRVKVTLDIPADDRAHDGAADPESAGKG